MAAKRARAASDAVGGSLAVPRGLAVVSSRSHRAPAMPQLPETAAAPEEGADDEIGAPLVFQCAACRAIVGDSFCMLGTHSALRTITLTRAGRPPA